MGFEKIAALGATNLINMVGNFVCLGYGQGDCVWLRMVSSELDASEGCRQVGNEVARRSMIRMKLMAVVGGVIVRSRWWGIGAACVDKPHPR
jgi:hypothetical protein